MLKKQYTILLVVLVVILFVINYNFVDSFISDLLNNRDEVVIERVIDGDTVKVDGYSVRLLGINAPELGEKYALAAKNYLELKVLNKTVYLEYGKEKYDKYNRILAYIFLEDENINLDLVERGLANYYFPSGKDKYYAEFRAAWRKCIERDLNFCGKSEDDCSDCINLARFDPAKEIVTLKNICSKECNLSGWELKDEGRNNFLLSDIILRSNEEHTMTFNDIWTRTGDTLFLRDENKKIILWQSY